MYLRNLGKNFCQSFYFKIKIIIIKCFKNKKMQNKMYKTVRHTLIASFFTLAMGSVFSQNNDPLVMILGKDSIRLSEFKASFEKNNSLKKTTEKELREYVDLFVNFRLKCAEARAMQLDTLPSLKRELNSYRTQAAAPYLTEKSVTEQLIDESIEHLHWDIRASHIMKKMPMSPTPEDTLKAYKEMMQMRNRILKGEKFADVAYAESDDPSARPQYRDGKMIRSGNRGDLGYFTAFQMIYEFEKGAYNTPMGKVSLPIRSSFGYHLIYVQDRRPAISRWKASQILITYPENATAKDSAATRQAAQQAYQDIQNGMSFEDAVAKYCTDEGLTLNKGEMDPFGSGRFEGDFMAPLFDTKAGEITRPFETRYGWHIVKVIDKEAFEESPNLRGDIKTKVNRDSRSNLGPEVLVSRLKKEYHFAEAVTKGKKANPVQDFYSIDSVSLFRGEWDKNDFTSDRLMFSFADRKITQKDFAAYIEKNQFAGMKPVSVKEVINYVYPLFVQRTILDYEDSQLENKYPEFRNLMREYSDGILLYELSERKVWGRSETDSTGLANYYESVKENYLYPVRAEATYYTLDNDKAYKLFCKMMDKGFSMESINQKFVQKNWIISVHQERYIQGADKNFDQLCPWGVLMQEGNLVINRPEEKRYITVSKLMPSPKPLSEVRGIVISQYQNLLEKEWVEQLHRDNDIFIDYQGILSLIR